jgi:biopolymer transport protein ExbD
MKKFKFIAFFAVLASLLIGFSVNASASSPSLKVNNIYSTSKAVTGTATKGVSIIVRNSKKTTIARSTASSTTGKFSAELHTNVKANQKLYVYARKSSTSYFYRIMTVKTPKSSTNTTTNSSSKSSSSKIKISEPTGRWQSGNNNGYSVVTNFSQKGGLNQGLYKNGKFQKKLINFANYKVTTYSKTFWGITYRERGSKTYHKFYLRFTDNTHFIIVNKANHAIKVQYANTPLHYYKFALVK